jgi:iron(III) transport system substrate-binding protein
MKVTLLTTLVASGIALATLSGAATQKVVWWSIAAPPTKCVKPKQSLRRKYDVKTSFIRNGSGSTLAKVDAEKKNPQADVWYGGTLDPQSQAGEMGLLQPYKSPIWARSWRNSAIRRS